MSRAEYSSSGGKDGLWRTWSQLFVRVPPAARSEKSQAGEFSSRKSARTSLLAIVDMGAEPSLLKWDFGSDGWILSVEKVKAGCLLLAMNDSTQVKVALSLSIILEQLQKRICFHIATSMVTNIISGMVFNRMCIDKTLPKGRSSYTIKFKFLHSCRGEETRPWCKHRGSGKTKVSIKVCCETTMWSYKGKMSCPVERENCAREWKDRRYSCCGYSRAFHSEWVCPGSAGISRSHHKRSLNMKVSSMLS